MSQHQYYTPTIGIECHVQLKTATKLFVGVDNDSRESDPNTLISPLCMGLPGTLPVLNEKAVELAIRAGLALNATIAHYSKFDRKHYFYPDLPLGYQITQYDEPIVLAGSLEVPLSNGRTVIVRIHHAHLEADAGKSTHPAGADYSLVDLNRVGTPLLEIVSEPDMHSAEEAKAYARELYLAMKYADVSDVNLFYGNMRFDVNVSVSADNQLGVRTETKNLNSFRAVEKAVEYEVARQIALLEDGEKIVQETRGWDDDKQVTFSQRSKEDAHDYRYFPDPDLPPIVLEQTVIEHIATKMPILPKELRSRFASLQLDQSAVEAIIDQPALAAELSRLIDETDTKTAKTIANWYTGEIARMLGQEDLTELQVVDASPLLKELVSMVDGGLVSSSVAKELLKEIITLQVSPKQLAEQKNLLQVSDEAELEVIVANILSTNPKVGEDIKSGEHKAIGFVVGQAMKATGGKANPGVVQNLVKKILGA